MSMRAAMQALWILSWFTEHGDAFAAFEKCGEEDCPAPTEAEAFIQMHGPVSQQIKPRQTHVKEDALEETAILARTLEKETEVEEEWWNKPDEHVRSLAQVAAKKTQKTGGFVNVTFPPCLPGKIVVCTQFNASTFIYAKGVKCDPHAAGHNTRIYERPNATLCMFGIGTNFRKPWSSPITVQCRIDGIPPEEKEIKKKEGLGPMLAQVLTKKTEEPVTVTFPKSSTGTVCVNASNTSCEFNAAGTGKLIYFGPNGTLCAMSMGENYGKGWSSSVSARCQKGGMPPPEEEEEEETEDEDWVA